MLDAFSRLQLSLILFLRGAFLPDTEAMNWATMRNPRTGDTLTVWAADECGQLISSIKRRGQAKDLPIGPLT
jgi:hypothetical protein